MSKTIIMVLGMTLASCMWLGCGVDDERQRPRVQNPAANAPLSAMSVEEREAATRDQDAKAKDVFVRADGSAADPTSDYRACRQKLIRDRQFVNADALRGTIMLVKCMSEKGWKTKQDARP